eukprot:1160381-Pelagomonas_calceolata.AAC.12
MHKSGDAVKFAKQPDLEFGEGQLPCRLNGALQGAGPHAQRDHAVLCIRVKAWTGSKVRVHWIALNFGSSEPREEVRAFHSMQGHPNLKRQRASFRAQNV